MQYTNVKRGALKKFSMGTQPPATGLRQHSSRVLAGQAVQLKPGALDLRNPTPAN
jgi:hypothetical protein